MAPIGLVIPDLEFDGQFVQSVAELGAVNVKRLEIGVFAFKRVTLVDFDPVFFFNAIKSKVSFLGQFFLLFRESGSCEFKENLILPEAAWAWQPQGLHTEGKTIVLTSNTVSPDNNGPHFFCIMHKRKSDCLVQRAHELANIELGFPERIVFQAFAAVIAVSYFD